MTCTIEQAYAELQQQGFSCGCPVPSFKEVYRPGSYVSRYALRANGEHICIPCAEAEEVQAFGEARVYTCYLSSDGRTLTTFTGRELAKVTREWTGRGGFGGSMTYVQAIGPDGSRWHGKGSGRGMVLTVRRGKGGA